ncbi:MAG: hypothetical protein GF419_03765 [Ignavibacteriales bacterium]|nr:hypothetical protein [Ignavibacteriales bacterium]
MDKSDLKTFAIILAVFLLFYYVPPDSPWLHAALANGVALASDYARAHVLLCLVPAFFIAGAVSTFLDRATVTRHLGASASKTKAYGVASISGGVLAVCSCTVLPMFAGIYRMGAGLGPATTFLYAGPAINVLAVALTASALGAELGVARAVGAVGLSLVVGLAMAAFFRTKPRADAANDPLAKADADESSLGVASAITAALIGALVFANWSDADPTMAPIKWYVVAVFGVSLAAILVARFRLPLWRIAASIAATGAAAFVDPTLAFTVAGAGLALTLHAEGGKLGEWLEETWGFAKQIMPLLFIGVFVAGAAFGAHEEPGLVPPEWVREAVGGESLLANALASALGALMYFATLTEIPIIEGLLDGGMGEGPALALLLAGPAVSLPNMLVVRSVLGTRKTLAFVGVTVLVSTAAGFVYGAMF